MKKITYIYIVLSAFAANSQVGIKTYTPEEELHIAGTDSNIRIEGLGQFYNPNNLGTGLTTKVYADANGDLVLGTLQDNVDVIFDSENYLEDVQNPTSLINQTGEGSGFSEVGIPIGGTATSFTLTQPAIVEVNYSVSWNIGKNATDRSRLDDYRARIIQTGIYFRQGNYLGPTVITDYYGNPINGIPLCITSTCSEQAGVIAINGQFYNNNYLKEGEWKNFRNTASDYVILGPGTYTPMFVAQLAVRDTSGTGAVKMYVGVGADELQIIAYYFN
ncbi:hypothetical protein DI487_07485 [Flavobacterium sediminis]|uniref:Uncharacterized protein n=1 Tax=Flavobacterium sediminis TaxID=2201181 RepID=A0A2U8QUF3_9FLAO|nr:hypothetical protein [Flavobacterium sediminis]AWM13719.1 hypothetical protein DI487_07485 [Flavobacterium sediminis]